MTRIQKLQRALYHAEQINKLLDRAYDNHEEATKMERAHVILWNNSHRKLVETILIRKGFYFETRVSARRNPHEWSYTISFPDKMVCSVHSAWAKQRNLVFREPLLTIGDLYEL